MSAVATGRKEVLSLAPARLPRPLRGSRPANSRAGVGPDRVPCGSWRKREARERTDRRLKRLLDGAHLPEGKTLAKLELERYPASMWAQIQDLCRGQFTSEAINICLVGTPGTGKCACAGGDRCGDWSRVGSRCSSKAQE
jgi:hypothetical protein